jgi:hypothetical protein
MMISIYFSDKPFKLVWLWLATLFMTGGFAYFSTVPAQLINRQFPESSELAYLSVLQFPDVIVNRKADRLSQGSLIRDQNNRIVLSGTLQGEYLVVYTRGIANEINLVWILREDEVARERERMKQKRAAEREAAR